MNVSMNVHRIVMLLYVTNEMEDAIVLLDMLVILVQNVHQTAIPQDVMMTFIVTYASLAFMVISVTKHAQSTVSTTGVTEMVDVHVMLDMQAILVKPVLRIVISLAVMKN